MGKIVIPLKNVGSSPLFATNVVKEDIAPACRSTQVPTNAKRNHTFRSSKNHSKTKYVSVEQQDNMEGSRDGNTENTEEFSIYTMSQ